MPIRQAPPAGTLAIVNARVWTGDPRRPWADAVLMQAGRIVAVGSSAEVKKRAGSAPVVDAKGRMIAPAASDAGLGTLAPEAAADLVMLAEPVAPVTAETIRAA